MPEDLPINDHLTLPGWLIVVETMRSSGSGGQHVNTTETAVRLRLHLDAAQLHPAVKDRLRKAFPSQTTSDGELLVHCGQHRSQRRNLDEARDRLAQMIRDHLRPPKRRRRTRPTRASKRRRLKDKRQRGEVKALRGRVDHDGG